MKNFWSSGEPSQEFPDDQHKTKTFEKLLDWWDKTLTFWKVYVLLHVAKTNTPTIKHGNGFVMIWGCFAISGPKRLAVIDRTMISALHQKILKKKALNPKHPLVMLQDNDLNRLKMKVLERPSRSPSSSQIEMLGMTSNRSLMFENPVMWLNYKKIMQKIVNQNSSRAMWKTHCQLS